MTSAAPQNEIDDLKAALAARDSRIRELEHLVDYLRRKPFRPSSEAFVGMDLLFDEAETEAAARTKDDAKSSRTKVSGHDRQKPVRRPLPESLPREIVRHVLPGDAQVCACCGDALHEIGVEATEQLDIIPQKMQVLRHERVKYGCRGCESAPITAPMPPQPLPKTMASPSTLAHIAVAKYADHLPLYRQEAMWKRLGVTLDRGTLATWMVRCGSLLQPLVNQLTEDILESPVVHCDETTVKVLEEKAKKSAAPGYMWVLSRAGPGPKAHVYEYDPSRSGRVAERLLAGYRGIVVTDGLASYHRLMRLGMTRAACWAHVRRKFFDAHTIDGKDGRSVVAAEALRLIGELYDVERRGDSLGAAEVLALRASHSRTVMRAIEAFFDRETARVPPKSPTGRALRYLQSEWQELQVFLRDGRVPIDNNRVENAIRPFALGRKNWLFSSTTEGARASGNLYSLIETAKANGLDPHAYLAQVFTELPRAATADDLAKLLPYPTPH